MTRSEQPSAVHDPSSGLVSFARAGRMILSLAPPPKC
jgi:hypothetical protein